MKKLLHALCEFFYPRELPLGWKIQFNGMEYRWVDEEGSPSAFTNFIRCSCVREAWRQYRYYQSLELRTKLDTKWRDV